MTINTKKTKNGQFKVSINQGRYTSSCTKKTKAAAYNIASAGLYKLLGMHK